MQDDNKGKRVEIVHRSFKGIIPVLVVLISVCLAGCGNPAAKAVDKAVEQAAAQNGVNAKVDTEKGTYSLADKNGTTAQYGGSISWPSDIPSDIPVFPGTIKISTSDKTGQYYLQIQNSDKNAVSDYVNILLAKGFQKGSEINTGSDYTVELTKDKITVTISNISSLENTAVVLISMDKQ